MIKFPLFLFVFTTSFLSLFAQNMRDEKGVGDTIIIGTFTKELNLFTSIGIAEFAQQDLMISPLTYKGWGYGAQVGLEYTKIKSITKFNFNWNQGKLYNNLQSKQNNIDVTNVNSYVNVNYRIIIRRLHDVSSYLGWQVAQNSDFRRSAQFQNSALTYNFTCSLAPTFRGEKYYSLKENTKRWLFKKGFNFQWNYQFALPVFSAVSRPNYNAIRTLNDGSGSTYQNSIQKEVIDNFNFYTINKLFAIDSKLEMLYPMQNGNKWALQFNWYFQNFSKESYQYKNSYTGIFLCFYSRLNKK